MARLSGRTLEEHRGNVPAEPAWRVSELHRAPALPSARAEVTWGHPAIADGTILLACAVHAGHLNLHTTPGSLAALADGGQLEGSMAGKGSIQLPHGGELPRELITRVAAARAAEYREHRVPWKS